MVLAPAEVLPLPKPSFQAPPPKLPEFPDLELATLGGGCIARALMLLATLVVGLCKVREVVQ